MKPLKNFPRFEPADLWTTVFIAMFVLLLAALPLLLPQQSFRYAFSEEGPFERLSVIGWITTALIVIARIRPFGFRAGAFALLCLLFAMREADLHKAFTADSILKSNYYKHAIAPLGEKLVAGIVAIASIALIVYIGFVVLRFLFLQGGWRSRSGFWLLFGTMLVLLGKVLDRAPSVLSEEYGIVLSPLVGHYAVAFEEGLEMIHPLILAWSAWISQRERRFLSP